MRLFRIVVNRNYFRWGFAILAACVVGAPVTRAQTTTLHDLSFFKDPGKTWRIAGAVTADLTNQNVLNVSPGTGILVNQPDKKNHGQDLYTREEFGDIDLELDYLMAKGSNSGIYLQGRYEVQLEDSWGITNPSAGKNGGIYERWDESRPKGSFGYEGYAPRQNASRAPGLWQHMKISFRAPRFDGRGNRTSPAMMLRVELNGVLIHENVELSGPTRGGAGPESATGPLRLQGDHGAVAFRNITITAAQERADEARPRRNNTVYPIMVNPVTTPVLRSFMDLPGGIRVVHAVSVSSPEKVHYTYDMDTGMLLQAWRGDFLDATPMWHNRGDGSSRPVGALQRFGAPALALAPLPAPGSSWVKDTTGSGFRPRGYTLDQQSRPSFVYESYGVRVSDATTILPNGEGISREVTLQQPGNQLYFRLAQGADIVELQKGLYLVDKGAYYVRLENSGDSKPVIRTSGGIQELIVPAGTRVRYSILF